MRRGTGGKMGARRTFCLRILLTVVLLAGGAVASACSASSLSADSVNEVDASASEGREGTWRGSVTYVKETVYGSSGGVEPMLDVTLSEDGTCTVEPLEAHSDLPSGDGTWEDLGDTIILNLGSIEVELQVIEGGRLEGDASDFGVHGYETMEFVYLG